MTKLNNVGGISAGPAALAEGGANNTALKMISRHGDDRSLDRYIHARDKVTEEPFRNINRA